MSPGVAAGNAEDTRCDIYAFGALLYEMLTGEPPYAGRNTEDIRQPNPGRPAQAHPRAATRKRTPALAAVSEGAMARELRDRYADMTDVWPIWSESSKAGRPSGRTAWCGGSGGFPARSGFPAGAALLALAVDALAGAAAQAVGHAPAVIRPRRLWS